MNIWRLIAHHDQAKEAIELMKETCRIAIGWSDIGNLKEKSQFEISQKIREIYPTLKNSHTGSPSLFHFCNDVKIGDLVIINVHGERDSVFEIIGDYEYVAKNFALLGYQHQRKAILLDINAEELWQSAKQIPSGENKRWTFIKCSITKKTKDIIYKEGTRYAVNATVVERNAQARKACLRFHGNYKCQICSFDFEKHYGKLGKNFIHVHHIEDISLKKEVYEINPEKDLIPICPNCHAMIHREKPAIKPNVLKTILDKSKN